MVKISRLFMFTLFFLFWLIATDLSAQATKYFGLCDQGTKAELETNICSHDIQDQNLLEKFDKTFIGNKPINCDGEEVPTLEDVQKYLKGLQARTGRKPAVLFYAYSRSKERLCIWLILPHEYFHSVENIKMDRIHALQANLMDALDVKNRAEQYMKQHSDLTVTGSNAQPSQGNSEKQLSEASEILLPSTLWNEIEKVDSLIVVPIYSFGEVPYSALRINHRALVDITSVVIVPGLNAFKETPRKAVGRFENPIIVGLSTYPKDPAYNLKASPEAAEEAKEIACLFGVEPPDKFIEKNASKSKIKNEISTGKQIGLIYISTHGVSDYNNPLDGGVIWLSDGRWSGRDVVKDMSSMKGQPLVVLSACQTGLGKTFEVGTIGMARAWYQAGASNVVMSLWRIESHATRQLMVGFMKNTKTMPADKALQKAMQALKKKCNSPALWSGFSILGLPE